MGFSQPRQIKVDPSHEDKQRALRELAVITEAINKAEIDRLKVKDLSSKIKKLEEKKMLYKDQIEGLQHKFSKEEVKVQKAQTKVDALEMKHKALLMDIEDFKERKKISEEEFEALRATIDSNEKNLRSTQRTNIEMENETAVLEEKKKNICDELCDLEKKVKELEEKTASLVEVRASFDAMTHEYKKIQRKVETANESLNGKYTEMDYIDSQITVKRKEAEEKGKKIIEKFELEVKARRENLLAKEGEYTKVDSILENKRKELRNFKMELEKHLGKSIQSIII